MRGKTARKLQRNNLMDHLAYRHEHLEADEEEVRRAVFALSHGQPPAGAWRGTWGRDWEIFGAYYYQKWSGTQIARSFAIPVPTVYQIRARLLDRLAEYIHYKRRASRIGPTGGD